MNPNTPKTLATAVVVALVALASACRAPSRRPEPPQRVTQPLPPLPPGFTPPQPQAMRPAPRLATTIPESVVLQAEKAALSGGASVVTAADAQEGRAVRMDSGSGDVLFQVPNLWPGPVYLWARVRAYGNAENSFFVTVPGGERETFDVPADGAFSWQQVRARGGGRLTIDPAVGSFALFETREAGAVLDALVATPDETLVPTDPPLPSGLSLTAPWILGGKRATGLYSVNWQAPEQMQGRRWLLQFAPGIPFQWSDGIDVGDTWQGVLPARSGTLFIRVIER